jgi:N-methylhydantoinase B/oxoprolinase/acetone carboxylase alpha subunit
LSFGARTVGGAAGSWDETIINADEAIIQTPTAGGYGDPCQRKA